MVFIMVQPGMLSSSVARLLAFWIEHQVVVVVSEWTGAGGKFCGSWLEHVHVLCKSHCRQGSVKLPAGFLEATLT
jgi:hypothetical protein